MFFPRSCSHTYLNRRWVLQQLVQETSLPSFVTKGTLGTIPAERTQRLIREEMEVCGEAAGRYPSNYNAWSHRIWVLQHLAKLDVKVRLRFQAPEAHSLSALKSSDRSSSSEELLRRKVEELMAQQPGRDLAADTSRETLAVNKSLHSSPVQFLALLRLVHR